MTRIKILVAGSLIFVITACSFPRYLPKADTIDINPYGAYIKVTLKKSGFVDGELIAVSTNEIVVFSENSNTCVSVPIPDIGYYKMFYAEPKNYVWSIPVFALASLPQGGLAFFTLPLNLITTIAVVVSSNKSFSYTEKSITYAQLSMFARFPQGLPETIDLNEIKQPDLLQFH